MLKEHVLEQYLAALLNGDRTACRTVIEETMQTGVPANSIYMDIIWPIMNEIENLYKAEKIDSAREAFATRINRTIVDQLQNKLPQRPRRLKKIVVCTTPNQQCELGAQITADLFESDGWEVRFLGGSVIHDDILEFVQSYHPDVLLIYGVTAKAAPSVRKLIDTIKTICAWPNMKVMLSGGIFDRAEGLWEEIGADLYADTAAEAVRIASTEQTELPKPQRTINRRKKKYAEKTETTPAEILN